MAVIPEAGLVPTKPSSRWKKPTTVVVAGLLGLAMVGAEGQCGPPPAPPERVVVEWPLKGDDSDPSGVDAVWARVMAARDCEAIKTLGDKLYDALSAACTATTTDASGDFWGTASRYLAANRAPDKADCEDRAAYQLLANLVDAHNRRPLRIELIDPKPRRSLCDYVVSLTSAPPS